MTSYRITVTARAQIAALYAFAFQPEGLVLIAVLHHRMDAVRHLGAALEELGSHRPRDR